MTIEIFKDNASNPLCLLNSINDKWVRFKTKNVTILLCRDC